MKAHRARRRRREDRATPALVEESPLRGADPRVKLALSLGLSLAVMLPLAQVAAALALYAWLLGALGLERYESTPPLLLSEGEKKRVALATVLMRRPRDGILLDEPALGQDEAHKACLLRLVRALADAGQWVAFTTHDLALASHADRLLLLAGGRLVAEGAPAALLGDDALCRRAGLCTPEQAARG